MRWVSVGTRKQFAIVDPFRMILGSFARFRGRMILGSFAISRSNAERPHHRSNPDNLGVLGSFARFELNRFAVGKNELPLGSGRR